MAINFSKKEIHRKNYRKGIYLKLLEKPIAPHQFLHRHISITNGDCKTGIIPTFNARNHPENQIP
jgi:hypothetical protein